MKLSVRSTLLKSAALLLALIALVLVYFFRSAGLSPAKNTGQIAVLPDLRPNDVLTVSLSWKTPTNSSALKLERKDGSWFLALPVKDDADPEPVALLLNSLAALKSEKIYTNSGASFEEFGFGDPAIMVEAGNSGGGTPRVRLTAGGVTSDGKYFYVIRGGDDKNIFLVPAGQFVNILVKADDFRGRELFRVDTRELSSLEWTDAHNGTFRFVFSGKDGSDVMMTSPQKLKADASLVRSKLIGLYSLAVSSYVNNDENRPLSVFGLEKPAYSIRLTARDGRSESLLVGKTDSSGSRYAYLSRKKCLVLISGDLAEILGMALEEVRPGKDRP